MLSLALALTLASSPPEVSRALGEETISIQVGHAFTLSDAHARVQMLLDYWGKAFGVRSEWVGERVWLQGQVWGIALHAYLDVAANTVRAVAADPGWLRDNAKDYVKRKLQKYLHPLYAEP